ncbi:hypothetical protein LGM65_20335 [Burkholderia anthina]|uniref:hypothetical protein n=1 Tax=Burkholderia anthina TaxID=179879 RepID=UPI001CF2DEA9|nr:hypothetical protein [Burkholderia anthina]MCA8093207.1 hypothetical protein [Burkholderia anthina]
MQRPTEYENLIKTKAFDAVAPTPGAIAGFLRNADDYKATADEPASIYLGLRRLLPGGTGRPGVLRGENQGCRRNLAIQRVSASLGVSAPEFAFITKAHERRNGTSYVSPFPPVSKAEAATMLSILAKYLPVARTLTGMP